MLVIGTASEVSFLDSVGIRDAFSVTYPVPTLKTEDAKKVKHDHFHHCYWLPNHIMESCMNLVTIT